MEKIRNLSIRKSIVLYVGAAVTTSFLLSIICMWSVGEIQQNIWKKYADSGKSLENVPDIYTENEPYNFSKKVERISGSDMSSKDAALSNLCDFIDTWCIPVIIITGCILSICLFYRNKIKKPLELLETGSQKISEQQLDFHIKYDNKDEMGKLCTEFEKMRAELEHNNKKMWRMLEQERTLRAAIAHDIRSPLAVIKGYQETLKLFIPTGRLDEKSMLEIADACLKQVDRLDEFVESMKRMSKVEEREPSPETVSLEDLTKRIQEITRFLNQSTEITCTLSADGAGLMEADWNIICEVYENLLSNALRYAGGKIDIQITKKGDYLELYVNDDGEGFGEDIHFGLGLYLCDVYCKKHGGYLQITNLPDKGASVKAVFQVKG